MSEFHVEKGHLYRGVKVQECPYSARGGVCGTWCPQFAEQEHMMVVGPARREVKLYCTGRSIVLAEGK